MATMYFYIDVASAPSVTRLDRLKVLVLAGRVAPLVSGYTCTFSNACYPQCLPVSSRSAATNSLTTTTEASSSTPTKASASPTMASSSGSGDMYKTTIAYFESGDSLGPPKCQTNTTACGYYASPSYLAAGSQNISSVGPGADSGRAYGTCWNLTTQTNVSGNPLANTRTSIILMAKNLYRASRQRPEIPEWFIRHRLIWCECPTRLCSNPGTTNGFFW